MTYDKPKTSTNYKGEQETIKWPKGKIISKCGNVYLIQQSKNLFATVYGLEVKQGFRLDNALSSFGYSCFHQAECEGLIS
jgi:hypothetical protein